MKCRSSLHNDWGLHLPETLETTPAVPSCSSFDQHSPGMLDLAPEIFRQRLVVEGLVHLPVEEGQVVDYLNRLSDVLAMETLMPPVTHRSSKYGWAAWIHWETSGAHFYAWDQPRLFFSVDIYTCKAFDPQIAISFTDSYFSPVRLVAKQF